MTFGLLRYKHIPAWIEAIHHRKCEVEMQMLSSFIWFTQIACHFHFNAPPMVCLSSFNLLWRWVLYSPFSTTLFLICIFQIISLAATKASTLIDKSNFSTHMRSWTHDTNDIYFFLLHIWITWQEFYSSLLNHDNEQWTRTRQWNSFELMNNN